MSAFIVRETTAGVDIETYSTKQEAQKRADDLNYLAANTPMDGRDYTVTTEPAAEQRKSNHWLNR